MAPDAITNLLLAGILAVLTGCWIRYADVDKHIKLLPQRLFHLARRPVEFTKRKRRDARDKRATEKRSAARDKALGRH